jgi:hypothetical protein
MEVGHTVIMHRRIVIICKMGWRKLCAGRSMMRLQEWLQEWLDEFGRKGGERSPGAGVQRRGVRQGINAGKVRNGIGGNGAVSG